MLYVIILSIVFGLKDAGGSNTMVPWEIMCWYYLIEILDELEKNLE